MNTLVSQLEQKVIQLEASNAGLREEVARLAELLFLAQEAEGVCLLTAGIAHDLNNVLTPLSVAADLLESNISEEKRRDLARLVKNSCQRGTSIVRQMNTFMQGITGEPIAIQMRHLCKQVVDVSNDKFPDNITAIENLPRNLRPVSGHVMQLYQVFLDLSRNARDAMPHGGEIVFEGENIQLEQCRKFRNLEIPPGDYIHINVVDSRKEIREEELEAILSQHVEDEIETSSLPFRRAALLDIVQEHGGLIEYHRRNGSGNCFSVYLPTTDI